MTGAGPGSRLPRQLAAAVGAAAADAGYAVGWSALRRLPERAAYRVFDAAADRVAARRGHGVLRLRDNLARVVPDPSGTGSERLDELVRQGMRSYFRYYCDAFRLPGWDERRIVEAVRTEGDGPVRDILATGQGVVCALAHLGNWDHAGAWSALRLARVTTVAERLRPERLYRRFVGFRTGLGIDILPLTGAGAPLPLLVDRLRAGGFVPLLADRDLTGRGTVVDLLGHPASVATGPAVLAARAGAALVPVTIHYERRADVGSGWGIVIRFRPAVAVAGDDPASVQAATARSVAALGEGIAAHPADWHMLQTVFVADVGRPPGRFVRACLTTAGEGTGRGGKAAGRGGEPERVCE